MRSTARTFALIIFCAIAGCAPREILKLHYLSGFVPGTRAIFLPANLAVAPIGGDLAAGAYDVGGIYNSSGHLEKVLRVSDAGAVVHDALMTSLADAGLKPITVAAGIGATDLKPGIDVMLRCDLRQIKSEKNFGAPQTIHGQYFTMTSRLRLKCKVERRDGSMAYENEIVGAEDEPPKPVGGEVFFPLETEPAESLSVALSRAIGALLADPKFQQLLPLRTAP